MTRCLISATKARQASDDKAIQLIDPEMTEHHGLRDKTGLE